MSEWKTYKLGDVVDMRNGKKRPKEAGNFPVYGGNGILDYTNQYNAENVIVVGRVGAYCGSVYRCKQKCWVSDNAICVNAKPIIDNNFLFYLMSSLDFHHFHIGGAQPLMTQDIIGSFEISLPPLAEQKRIADILSAIDGKIELNRRINANLEQQAQALYKSWFVDFEFPNEEGKPYKSSGGKMQKSELGLIPKGWNIDKLGNKVVIKRGGSPRPIQDFLALKGLRWLKISDATAEPSPYIYKIKEFIKEEGLSKTVFLNKGELVLSNSATPGLPKLLGLDTCIHDGWLYFPKSDFSKEYLFELFLFEREKILSQANGSVFSNLKTDILKALTIIVPQENVLNRFQNIIGQIFRSIQQKQEEIISLTTLRDTLLPELMSGEIKA